MSDIQEQESQVADAQAAQVGGNDEVESLKAQLAASQQANAKLKANNDKLLTEKQNQAESFAEQKREFTERSQRDLADRGDWKQLYQDLQKTHAAELARSADLEKQVAAKDEAARQLTVKQQAIASFQQAGAINPEDAYALYQNKIELNEAGEVVAMDGGVQKPIAEFTNSLKNPDSARAYLFNSSGARGMSAVGTTTQSAGETNPYLTGNFAQVCELEMNDPQRAAQLKAQAGQ